MRFILQTFPFVQCLHFCIWKKIQFYTAPRLLQDMIVSVQTTSVCKNCWYALLCNNEEELCVLKQFSATELRGILRPEAGRALLSNKLRLMLLHCWTTTGLSFYQLWTWLRSSLISQRLSLCFCTYRKVFQIT